MALALLEVLDVALTGYDPERVIACALGEPAEGSSGDTYALTIDGWVLGRNVPAAQVNLIYQGAVVQAMPVNIARPDVIPHFPKVSWAGESGFQGAVSLFGVDREFELLLQVVYQNGEASYLGAIRGRRGLLRTGFRPQLEPLLATGLGRSGTTLLMRLLAEHPGIVARRAYPYETSGSQHWVNMLKVSTETEAAPQFIERFIGAGSDLPQLRPWFKRTHIEQLACYCQKTTESFYQHVASIQGTTAPVYFAEKSPPNRIPSMVKELYPAAREVVLVRDFRDVVCSVLAFNAKRGYVAFGREAAASDAEYVRTLRGGARQLLQSWRQRAGQAHLVRYEDLVLRPEGALRGILDYLGLDASAETVAGVLARALADTPELAAHRTTTDPRASIGRWRRDLDPALQAVCREAFDDILLEFGYEPEYDEETVVS